MTTPNFAGRLDLDGEQLQETLLDWSIYPAGDLALDQNATPSTSTDEKLQCRGGCRVNGNENARFVKTCLKGLAVIAILAVPTFFFFKRFEL